MHKISKAIIAVSIGLAMAILFTSFSGFAHECTEIRKSVFRLHIIANSDSEQDQQLKLKVRDAILKRTKGMFDCQSAQDAKSSAEKNIVLIESIARQVIKEEGYSYNVKAQVVNMFFNTRQYDDITMPAGKYDALRITIGDAAGHNWWCVMYPPICLPSAQPKKELSDVLTESQTDIVENEPKYEIKFKLVEVIESIKNSIFG